MGLTRTLAQSQLCTIRWIHRCELLSKYCTNVRTDYEMPSKSITDKFTQSIRAVEEHKKITKARTQPKNSEGTNKLLKPVDGYTSRFKYNGYLKKTHWQYYDENRQVDTSETEAQYKYKMLKKQKFCLLMAFAGGNYHGMQYNVNFNTIEENLFNAMIRNGWILDEHINKPWLVEFQRTSRTDRGVSAARQNISMILPIDVNIDDLNRDLPSDIRVFGMKRTTRSFDARHNCYGRTYSYTLPTIAFAHYNDQTGMKDYRISADRLQRANEILALYNGQTNFHNYTIKKQYFDRSSQRHINDIRCDELFIENDIEFARIIVTGQSFMLHQIRRMVGFSLAVIREVVGDDMLKRSLTKEVFHTPTAPGLGLMLERLHFDKYSNLFKNHDPLTFEEFDDDVERFRREKIHPFIVETEIKEQSMVQWLEYLCIHKFDAESREREENRRYRDDPQFSDDWGENEQFLEKLNKRLEE